jgi:arabinofuranosyltransferase
MLGLNDAHIAKWEVKGTITPSQEVAGHRKGDGAYVLSRQPDYIIIGSAEGRLISEPWCLSDFEMAIDPEFPALYELVEITLPLVASSDFVFAYYQRKGAQP